MFMFIGQGGQVPVLRHFVWLPHWTGCKFCKIRNTSSCNMPIFVRGVSSTPIGIEQIKLGNHLRPSFLVSESFYFVWNQVCLCATPPNCLLNLTLDLFLKICILAHEENQFNNEFSHYLKDCFSPLMSHIQEDKSWPSQALSSSGKV